MQVFLIIFWWVLPSVRAQTLTLDINSGDVTFVQLGNTLELDVSYTYTGGDTVIVQWEFNNTNVIGKVGSGNPQGINPRASIRGKATLVLRNTILSDNGTYSVEVSILGGAKVDKSFQVIIQEQPTAVTNCSDTRTLKEGDNLTCLCDSQRGNPPPTASWSKDGLGGFGTGYLKTYLVLKNLRNGNAGTYNCTVRSHNLQDDKSFKLVVDYKPKIISFKSDQENNIATAGQNMTITCKADALAPDYTILHNDTILTGVTNAVKTIQSVNYSHSGHYECIAKNRLASASRSFFLIVKDFRWRPTTAVKEKSNCNKTRIEWPWYVAVITLILGICIGMILLYAMQSLRQRLKNRKENSNPVADTIPEANRNEAEDNSTYQELELQHKEPENSYQALRVNTRKRMNHETKIEDEAGYQELDKVREKDNDYQSLNRV